MGCSAPRPLLIILHFFSFAALVIAGSTYSYFLSKNKQSWTIRTGCEVENSCNIRFYYNFSSVAFATISFLYAIVEFLMIFQIKQLSKVDLSLVKAIVYIVDGICVLGICGDLGIAAGSLTMAAGVIWVVFFIIAQMS